MIRLKATYQKYCQSCRTSKPMVAFDKSYRSKDGLKTKCIECHKPKKEENQKVDNTFDFIDRIGVLELGMSIDNFPDYTVYDMGKYQYIEIEDLPLFDDIKDAEFIKENISPIETYKLSDATLCFYQDKLFNVVTGYDSIINKYLIEKYGRRIEDDGDDSLYIYYGCNCWVEVNLDDCFGLYFEDTYVSELIDDLD